MTAKKKVIVIGAGIIGTTLSYRMAQAGAEVLQLERHWPGSLTTANGYGLLTAQKARPLPHFQLNILAMEEHARLAEELGDGTWYHRGGSLEHLEDHELETMKGLVALWSGLGYQTRIVDNDEVRRIEPDIIFRDNEDAFVYAPDDAFVYPMEYLGRMLRAAKDAGVALRNGTEVVDFIVDGNVVRGVVTANGERLDADAVVLAASSFNKALGAKLGYDLPLVGVGEKQDSGAGYMRQTTGMLAVTSKIPARMSGFIRLPEIQMRPDGAGHFLVQAIDVEYQVDPKSPAWPLPPQTEILLERVRGRLPYMETARIESVHRGTRVISGDGLPVVGWVPGVENAYLVVPHAGINQSAALARLVSTEVARSIHSPMLDAFRPSRFADPEAMAENRRLVSVWAGGRHE